MGFNRLQANFQRRFYIFHFTIKKTIALPTISIGQANFHNIDFRAFDSGVCCLNGCRHCSGFNNAQRLCITRLTFSQHRLINLVVDIGNTETVLGLVSSVGEVVDHWRLSSGQPRTADEFDHLIHALLVRRGFAEEEIRRGVLGSVVPSVKVRIQQALEGLLSGPVFSVSPNVDLPIRLDVDEPQTVGADRIVNTLAAKELYGRDTVVVDLGTATTFDCISGEGVFLGGVIGPGVQVGLEWLSRKAAKLPRVEFRPPDTVIGRRTESCMQSGIFFSTVDAIDGMVTRIKEEWGSSELLVVATGGHAPLLAPHCRSVERVEPFLTLQGLFLAGEHMAK